MMSNHARPEPEGSTSESWRPNGRQIVGIVVAVVLVVFIAANTTDVPINFVFTTVTLSLWVVLAGTALLGVLVGFGLGTRRTKKKYLGPGGKARK